MEKGEVVRVLGPGDETPSGGDRFDAGGKRAFPGFIDMHCHGAMGHDVTDGTLEAIKEIARAKLAEGVTTFCPTTLTLPFERLEAAARAVAAYGKNPRYARVAGLHLEGPFINAACTGAQNPDYVRPPDIGEVLRLNAVARVAIVTFAVEAEGGMAFLAGLKEAGIVPSLGHTAAKSALFRAARRAGLRNLTHFCNQMTGLHHREVGLVGAGLLDDGVLVELICDTIHLCPDMIALVFKVKPIERIALITDAIRAAGLADGEYKLGGLAVRVADGVARLLANGALAGSTLRLNRALKNVRDVTSLPLSELVRTTSLNQAQCLGLEKRGRIAPGFAADVTILDEDFDVAAVFVGGERRV